MSDNKYLVFGSWILKKNVLNDDQPDLSLNTYIYVKKKKKKKKMS